MNGLLVIDKTAGMTSRKAIDCVGKWFPRKTKLGHTGTLDPLATGVLVICIGAATRLADRVQAMGKGYLTRIRLGATSSTDDADGEIAVASVGSPPTLGEIEALLPRFLGVIDQVPPAYSAVKVDGRRSHAIARSGMPVAIEPRPVRIDSIAIDQYSWPFLDLTIECGKGTYIRSIAREIGSHLGCGGLVQTLRRTHVGTFHVSQAMTLDQDSATARSRILPMELALGDMPRVYLSEIEARQFAQGQTIPHTVASEMAPRERAVAVFDSRSRFFALGIDDPLRGVRPDIVLFMPWE